MTLCKKSVIVLLLALVALCSFIAATPAEADALPFSDVYTTDWFYNDVATAYNDGLINGKSATKFDPYANMTYAEAIKLAACMHQKNATGKVTLVPGADPWYQTYVDYAYMNGIIDNKNIFDWKANATRGGYIYIFANALPESSFTPINYIADNSIPDINNAYYYADAVYKLYRAGIVTGTNATTHPCNPTSNIRRSEVAAIVTRMMYVNARQSFSMGAESIVAKATADNLTSISLTIFDSTRIECTATGGVEPYKYQWYWAGPDKKFYDMSTYATFDTDMKAMMVRADPRYNKQYMKCSVTDSTGKTVFSNEISFTVTDAEDAASVLKVTAQPAATVYGDHGDWCTINVGVTGGTAPYTYQWQYAQDNYSNPGWQNCVPNTYYSGVNSATFKFEVFQGEPDHRRYRCKITDATGSVVYSNATALKLSGLKITAQPKNYFTSNQSGFASFSVAVNGGTAPYTYLWQFNLGNGIWADCYYTSFDWYPGYNSPEFSPKIIQSEMGVYSYRCKITDANGTVIYSDVVQILAK